MNLEDARAVVGQHLFERVDLVIAALDRLGGREFLHFDNKHILVMRAVENADETALRTGLVDAPEIVMGELVLRRRLEGRHRHADRPAMIEDGAHRAVLAGAVHALQDDQQRALAFGKEPVLQVIDRLGIFARSAASARPCRDGRFSLRSGISRGRISCLGNAVAGEIGLGHGIFPRCVDPLDCRVGGSYAQ